MAKELSLIVKLELTNPVTERKAKRFAAAAQRTLDWVLGADVSETEILNENEVEKVTVTHNGWKEI